MCGGGGEGGDSDTDTGFGLGSFGMGPSLPDTVGYGPATSGQGVPNANDYGAPVSRDEAGLVGDMVDFAGKGVGAAVADQVGMAPTGTTTDVSLNNSGGSTRGGGDYVPDTRVGGNAGGGGNSGNNGGGSGGGTGTGGGGNGGNSGPEWDTNGNGTRDPWERNMADGVSYDRDNEYYVDADGRRVNRKTGDQWNTDNGRWVNGQRVDQRYQTQRVDGAGELYRVPGAGWYNRFGQRVDPNTGDVTFGERTDADPFRSDAGTRDYDAIYGNVARGADAWNTEQDLVDWDKELRGIRTDTRDDVFNILRDDGALQGNRGYVRDAIGDIVSGIDRGSENLGSYFTPDDIATSVMGDITADTRNDLGTMFDPYMATGYTEGLYDDDFTDMYNGILDPQYSKATTFLDQALARGQINQAGYDAGVGKLDTARTGALSDLEGIGEGILGGYQTGTDNFIDSSWSDAQGWSAGKPQYDFGGFESGLTDRVEDDLAGFGGELTSTVGDRSFFDPQSIVRGGVEASGTFNPSGSASALQAAMQQRDKKNNEQRGLGGQGTF